jgi:hypothetical protein
MTVGIEGPVQGAGVQTIGAGTGISNTGTAQNPVITAVVGSNISQTTVATPGTALTTATTANVTSKSLAAGTYLVWGVVDFLATTATMTDLQCGIGVATGVLLGQAGGSGVGPDPNGNAPFNTTAATTETAIVACGPTIVTLASTTTIFLNAQATFSAGTVSAFGTLNAIQLK